MTNLPDPLEEEIRNHPRAMVSTDDNYPDIVQIAMKDLVDLVQADRIRVAREEWQSLINATSRAAGKGAETITTKGIFRMANDRIKELEDLDSIEATDKQEGEE